VNEDSETGHRFTQKRQDAEPAALSLSAAKKMQHLLAT
jgi:hypothetical protein